MVRCVNADGTMVGVVPTKEALKLAIDQGLDLVEVSPNANPPVCRIMDFGKFRYDESIKEKEARKKTHRQSLKEMKFHANVGEHDYEYKVNHIKDFLGKGHRVKVSLQFRGRENAHRELGFDVIKRVIKDCEEFGSVELMPRLMGNTIVSMLAPRPGKRSDGCARVGEPAVARPAAASSSAPAAASQGASAASNPP